MIERPEVLIVGAGPTGLASALFLADRGVRVRVVDKAPLPTTTSRAQVVNPRSLELLAKTGVTERILAEGRVVTAVKFYEEWAPVAEIDYRELPGPELTPEARAPTTDLRIRRRREGRDREGSHRETGGRWRASSPSSFAER